MVTRCFVRKATNYPECSGGSPGLAIEVLAFSWAVLLFFWTWIVLSILANGLTLEKSVTKNEVNYVLLVFGRWEHFFAAFDIYSKYQPDAIQIMAAESLKEFHPDNLFILYTLCDIRYDSRQTEKRNKTYNFRWAISRAVR